MKTKEKNKKTKIEIIKKGSVKKTDLSNKKKIEELNCTQVNKVERIPRFL